MKVTIPSFTFLLALFFGHLAFSQSKDTLSLNTIISKTNAFAEKYPQEKMHLHFDKPYYALGDTIWFKAYLTTGVYFPSSLSKVLYVDVTNKQDSLVQSLKLPVNNGIAWGNIALDAQKYQQGNYRIRSYTRWMMNFEPDYFFVKNIAVGHSDKKVNTHISFLKNGQNTIASIVYKSTEGMLYDNKKVSWSINGSGNQLLKGKGTTNSDGKITLTIPANGELKNLTLNTLIEISEKTVSNTFTLPSGDAIDLQFFPEGGDLVNGLPSKVAFKALTAEGLGINIKGNIVDNEAKVVGTFESTHVGMGSFILLPEDGKKYKAIITSSGNSNQYPLPEAKPSGISMTVKATGTDTLITARIICNEKFLSINQNQRFYITAKVDETIYYAAQAKLQSQAITLNIPKSKFPTGIVQLTVLSSAGIPQTERLVFVNQPRYVKPEFKN